jgi:hypothetical protein
LRFATLPFPEALSTPEFANDNLVLEVES